MPPETGLNVTVMHRMCALLAFATGDLVAGGRCARSAARTASATEFPMIGGAGALDLARVLSALVRGDEALLEARCALGEFERKGDQPGVVATQALLEELAAR